MIEIILVIAVVYWFTKTAKSRNKNHVLWGIIGALSYYVPVLLFGLFILPFITAGWLTSDNEILLLIVGIFLSIGVGMIGVLIAKKFLEKAD